MSRAAALLERATGALLGARPAAPWRGELSSSALSTATAACALHLYERARSPAGDAGLRRLVEEALAWVDRHQNADGGWGDTADSPSNASTTLLCWAALGAEAARTRCTPARRAEDWLRRRAGALTPGHLSRAILEAYGDDRTFSIPILTMCALSGRFGSGRAAWRWVRPIPFELAALPHRWLDRVGLPMVSYALPALIAVGQVGHHHRPTRNPPLRLLRNRLRRRTLEVLERIQPESGGYLEAAPLTSFVVMSLVGCGLADHPVASRGVGFLAATRRGDGSWPIDTNLATWLTTSSVQALAAGGRIERLLRAPERDRVLRWLLDQQMLREHPYTHAAPGGWAWTDSSGGVPDADDTSGALLALWALADAEGGEVRCALAERGALGVRWLLDLQNADGGVPTFCRGWTRLPFDRSSPDITAHALRAWARWRHALPSELSGRIDRASAAAVRYLAREQRSDGAWLPLWFGNQGEPSLENPVYGTARVLLASHVAAGHPAAERTWRAALARGRSWLAAAQNADGGWGAGGTPSSVEETAVALEALAECGESGSAIERGVEWLERATGGGARFEPAPIGLYFARLWYSERLYPIIFSVAALERLRARAPEARPEAAAGGVSA